MSDTKTCPTCCADLPRSEFGRNCRLPDGLQCSCKPCTRKYSNAYYRKRVDDPNQGSDYLQRIYDASFESSLRQYGITRAKYDALAVKGCAICGGQAVGRRRLSIDHDHATGAVRGLLCNPCNTGIGHLGDAAPNVQRAAAYLEFTAPELIWSDTEMS